MAQRTHQLRRQTQEYLHDWLGIDISTSTSTINRCIHEAGRAVESLEEELVQELKAAVLLHVDKTPWKEWANCCGCGSLSPPECAYFSTATAANNC